MPVARSIAGRDTAVYPWDCEIRYSAPALQAFTRALVTVRGWFTDSYVRGEVHPGSRSAELAFRIWLPEGTDAAFRELVPVLDLRQPACLMLNDSRDRRRICEACGKAFNDRLGAESRHGDGLDSMVREASRLNTCSAFCAGRLAGRADRSPCLVPSADPPAPQNAQETPPRA